MPALAEVALARPPISGMASAAIATPTRVTVRFFLAPSFPGGRCPSVAMACRICRMRFMVTSCDVGLRSVSCPRRHLAGSLPAEYALVKSMPPAAGCCAHIFCYVRRLQASRSLRADSITFLCGCGLDVRPRGWLGGWLSGAPVMLFEDCPLGDGPGVSGLIRGSACGGRERPAEEAVQGRGGVLRAQRVDRRVGSSERVGLVVYDRGPGRGHLGAVGPGLCAQPGGRAVGVALGHDPDHPVAAPVS